MSTAKNPLAGFFVAHARQERGKLGPMVWAGYATNCAAAFRAAWRSVREMGIETESISMGCYEPSMEGVTTHGILDRRMYRAQVA